MSQVLGRCATIGDRLRIQPSADIPALPRYRFRWWGCSSVRRVSASCQCWCLVLCWRRVLKSRGSPVAVSPRPLGGGARGKTGRSSRLLARAKNPLILGLTARLSRPDCYARSSRRHVQVMCCAFFRVSDLIGALFFSDDRSGFVYAGPVTSLTPHVPESSRG